MATKEEAIEILSLIKECGKPPMHQPSSWASKGQGFVLVYLAKSQDEVTAGILAKEMGVSTARVAKLLQKMEKSELIRTYSSPRDKRKTIVVLSSKGMSKQQEMKDEFLEEIRLLIDRIGLDKLKDYIKLKKQIHEEMERIHRNKQTN